MSLDLYEQEIQERMRGARPSPVADVGVWDGFVRGTGLSTMRGLAKVARAVDILGSVGPIVQDAFTGGTEAQDKYFREHDEVWGSAVDFWTPKPREVGAAAEIAGSLISTLPLVIANPSLAVGSLQLSTAEDLVKKGVDARLANVVGATQGAGLGLGIYMPIFGRTLTERVLAGGVGFNLLQGIAMRGSAEVLLEGTQAAEDFKAFDWTNLTLDVLLGAAFGGIVHLSPAQRAQGAAMWERLSRFATGLRQTDLDALAVLRQAQHLNADSRPGRPADPVDVERHATRVRHAIEQLARNEPVDVTDLPAPRFEADQPRIQEMAARARELAELAEGVRVAEGLPKPPAIEIPEMPGLAPAHRAMEARARRQVQNDLDGQLRRYARLQDSVDGKILNTDIARELFDDYNASNEARALNSAAVHEPASAVVKALYERKLAEPDQNGLNMVTFTAGGTGAGKTSSLGAVPLASNIVEASQIVYDTNMANARSGIQKIDQALAAGKQVNILYVGANPVEAFRRMLKRAMKIGRTVPLEEHAKTHQGSALAMQQLLEHYQGNDRVQFVFLDNGVGAKGEVGIVEPRDAPAFLRSLSEDSLEPKLKEIADAELKAGRISEAVHRGTTRAFAEPESASPGAGSGRQSAQGAEGEKAGPREEVDARQPAQPGEKLLVFRLGSEAGGLEDRNAGNAFALGRFLARLDDVEAPQPAGGTGVFLTAYEVSAPQGFGKYDNFTKGRALDGAPGELPGRGGVGADPRLVQYSFPKGGAWKAKPLGKVSLEDVRAALTEVSEYKNFDDAGGELAAKAVRKAIESKLPKAEAPAAGRPGGTEPPPPRGSAGEKAAGAEAPDPVQLAAERFAAERPDMLLRVGEDSNGQPILKTVRDYLDDIARQADEAAEDAKLFEIAATCLLGRG